MTDLKAKMEELKVLNREWQELPLHHLAKEISYHNFEMAAENLVMPLIARVEELEKENRRLKSNNDREQEHIDYLNDRLSAKLPDKLYTAYDFLLGTLHVEQPCDCVDCRRMKFALLKLEKFINDAGGEVPPEKQVGR